MWWQFEGYRMVKSELWRACDLLVLKSECELFWKRSIRAPSFSISGTKLWACFINLNCFKSPFINETKNPSLRASNNTNSKPVLGWKKTNSSLDFLYLIFLSINKICWALHFHIDHCTPLICWNLVQYCGVEPKCHHLKRMVKPWCTLFHSHLFLTCYRYW